MAVLQPAAVSSWHRGGVCAFRLTPRLASFGVTRRLGIERQPPCSPGVGTRCRTRFSAVSLHEQIRIHRPGELSSRIAFMFCSSLGTLVPGLRYAQTRPGDKDALWPIASSAADAEFLSGRGSHRRGGVVCSNFKRLGGEGPKLLFWTPVDLGPVAWVRT